MKDPTREEIVVYPGEWWCPDCCRVVKDNVSVEKQGPMCGCGTPLEVAGEGDDDPYPWDPDWRD